MAQLAFILFFFVHLVASSYQPTWDGENGKVLTGVLLTGVLLGVIQESRKERPVLVPPSKTGERLSFLFFCLLSTAGGVPKLMSVQGEMGMSSPLLPLLRSEMVWPSKRYSVTFCDEQ